MMRRLILLLCTSCAALAGHHDAVGVELPEELATVPSSAARIREMEGAIQERFDAVLLDYDAGVARNAHDVLAALDRCQFILELAGTYEYASFAESLYERADDCFERVRDERPEHPEVVLSSLSRTYGDERFQAALKALADTATQLWTPGQLARLHTLLATAAQAAGDQRSFGFAQRALQLDEAADVRVLLATEWVKRGNKEETVRVLAAPVDGHDPRDAWYLTTKMRLLADVGAREAVVQLYATLREHPSFDAVSAAGALRKVGAIAEAREAFGKVAPEVMNALNVARERFRFELEHGDPAEALGAYNAWRDAGWQEDPLAINRVALFLRAPALPWQARDVLSAAMIFAALAVIALLAAVPVGFVHYRGLARRARTATPYPQDGWRLRHAWGALLAFFVAELVAMYTVGPLDINALDGRIWGLDASPAQVARLTVSGDFVLLALLLPLALAARKRQPNLWCSNWSPVVSVAVGVLLGVALRTPLLLQAAIGEGQVSPGATQQLLWQILDAVRETYGIATAFWIVVVTAPVLEEFIFRGVLLRAFSQHIRFVWANLLQAALFALVHFDLRATPTLFVIGLCLGLLARRSGGLAGPIACHLVFNLILALLVLL